jgi:hypothetical protein
VHELQSFPIFWVGVGVDNSILWLSFAQQKWPLTSARVLHQLAAVACGARVEVDVAGVDFIKRFGPKFDGWTPIKFVTLTLYLF